MAKRSTLRALVALLFLVVFGLARAAILPGTPTTTIPSSLVDPLSSLSSPLPADAFLLPIEITGANGLQDWSFDLNFDDGVVAPLDVGGLFHSVYQAEFNASDTTESNITSSGLLDSFNPGVLQTIAGFSSGVSGDGLLAFVLFEFKPGQQDPFPAFSVSNVTTAQAPEPGTLVLLAGGLVLLGSRRLVRRGQRN